MADKRQVKISTPLGEDELRVINMFGSEELGRLFQYQLELHSANEEVDIDAILGQNITVSLVHDDGTFRYFNGFVSRFSQVGRTEGGYATYEAKMSPWLWFLTRTSDCRIFQEKTVPDIIKEIFNDNGFSDFEESLSSSYHTWEYCVQYRESDFNFVSRLMEQEGIYYFFRHESDKHVLVLADGYSSHQPIAGNNTLRYYVPGIAAYAGTEATVSDWYLTREVQPGAYAATDYDFKRPKTDLRVNCPIPRDHAACEYELFDYPGAYYDKADGDQYSQARIEEVHTQFEKVSAQTDAQTMVAGGLFELTEHTRSDQNREYLVTAASVRCGNGELASGSAPSESVVYQCDFTAIESRTPYRSARESAKPVIQGPQTAVVVGPSGEEIYPDEYGRIKVQFHWDRYGRMDENSSCWIRVAQIAAGPGWGAQFLPRIGQEVMVEFLEGDPDQPIITGLVYNADNMPPYSLPDNKTQSGVKTRSTKEGSASNCNEIRLEDKKGSEEFFVQAEKDYNQVIKNNRSESVGNDRSLSVGNDKSESIGNNKTIAVATDHTETIGANKSMAVGVSHNETIGSNMTISVGGSLTETVAINYMENVGAAMELTVGAMMAETVGANKNQTIGINKSINIGKDKTEDVGGNKSVSVGKDQKVDIGKTLTFDVADQITIKTGKASIVMKKDGTITISGKDISIDGKGKILVQASKDITVKSSANITMKGKKILQN